MSMNQGYGQQIGVPLGGPIQGNQQPAPLREGGWQMRLLETRKMIEDAHCMINRIETSSGTSVPLPPSGSPVVQGQITLDSIINETAQRMRELCERMSRHENQF